MAIIDKPSDYFNTVLYTGTNSSQAITGVGHQPDLSWFKTRSDANGHTLIDSVRGLTKRLASHNAQGDITQADMLTSFDSDGFTLGADSNNYTNWSGKTWVSWNWKAGGTASSNTDGSITSSVSANQDAGFSIVSWTGNGTNPSTIGHGLNQTPDVILLKNRDTSATNWIMYHSANTSAPETDYLILDSTNATADSANVWSDTAPTSSVFTVGSAGSVNNNGDDFITYCFHSVKGFSKFGSYTGNGSTDGTFVYTGFKPAFVMLKSSSSGSVGWITHDNKRIGFNPNNYYVEPNNSNAESADTDKILLLSNGFKLTSTSASWNASGGTYIYMCFAENPLVSSAGVPCTAR